MNNNNNEHENKAKSIKIIIIGSVNVGKTSLLMRYATGTFRNISKSTSNASFITKTKEINNKKYEIRIWDTAGQEKYLSLTKIFVKDAKIALLVYAINDRKSFNDLNMWLNIVKEINSDKIVLGVAANKADLYKEAKVTDEEGRKYAKEIGAEWRSTSSLLDDCGIDELVDILFNKYIILKTLKKTGSFIAQDSIMLDNNKNERTSGCCGGQNNSKHKSIKSDEIIEKKDIIKENDDF